MKLSPLPLFGLFEDSEASAGENRLERFRNLYEEHSHQLRRTLTGVVGRDHSDDLLQETYLRAWRAWDDFRGESQAKTWLHRIAINAALDFKKKKKPDLVADMDEEIDQQSHAHSQGFENGLEKTKLLGDLIDKGIAEMTEEHRITFVLFYRGEFSVDEIAITLGIPEGTVKSRLFKARERFIDFLAKNGVNYEL